MGYFTSITLQFILTVRVMKWKKVKRAGHVASVRRNKKMLGKF
jgi:hypothetical protein